MKRPTPFLLIAVLLLWPSAPLHGQLTPPVRGSGYLFAAGGGAVGDGTDVGILHFGLGGELLGRGRLGVAAELGHVISMANVGSGLSILSPGIVYRLSERAARSVYVTAGYSLFFESTSVGASGLHAGVGLLLWPAGNRGLRLEGRAQWRPEGDLSVYELRVSRAFR